MPEGHRFTSIGTAAARRGPAHGIVNCASACQTSRFVSDMTFFESDSSPTMKDMAELMTVIGELVSLMTALLFHVTAVVSVMGALMRVIVALLFHVIRVTSVMTAVMTDVTRVMSVIVWITWVMGGTMSG